jgi:hypothetical protein
VTGGIFSNVTFTANPKHAQKNQNGALTSLSARYIVPCNGGQKREINLCANFAQKFRIKLNATVIQFTDGRRRSWKKKPGEVMKRVTGATEGAERSSL